MELIHFFKFKIKRIEPNKLHQVVVELPKLYGLHVLVIVFQTSDGYTWQTDSSASLSGVLEEPWIIHFNFPSRIHYRRHCSITTVCTNIQICYIRVNGRSLTNHKFKSFIKLIQTINFSQLGSRVAWQVPLYNTQKRIHPSQGCTSNTSTASSPPTTRV
jgi:hypothetical protein